MDTSFEQQVRERAYDIWMSTGMTDGMAHDHWIAAETALITKKTPAKKAKATAVKAAAPKAVAKKAAPKASPKAVVAKSSVGKAAKAKAELH